MRGAPAADTPAHAETGPHEGWAPGVVRDWPPIDDVHEIVTEPAKLDALVAEAYESGVLGLHVTTSGPDAMQAEICGIALAPQPGRTTYLPLGHRAGETDLLGDGLAPDQMPLEDALAALRPVLEDPAILKIGHDVKQAAKILARHGIQLSTADDAMLLSYAVESGLGGHGLTELSERHLRHRPGALAELLGSGRNAITFDRLPVPRAAPHAAAQADLAHRLWTALRPRLARDRLSRVYHTLERPLVPVLAQMEAAGVQVDRRTLGDMSARFAQKMAEHEDDIYRLAGRQFHIGSPKQLGEILFDEMGLPGGKRTKTGAWATPAEQLEELAAEGHDLPARVLDWRQLSKLKSTYTDALPTYIHPETGRVHTTFSLASTSTGRLSSNDPNLQNIPIRTEEGRAIRTAFVAAPGNVLVSLDYSQIELRILAHIADIGPLKEAFRRRRGHPRHDRLPGLRRADGADDARDPPPRQGDQLRRDLRHFGVRAVEQPPHPARRRAGLHRRLFRAFPRHPRLHGDDQGARPRARLRRDPVRPPHPHPRHRQQGPAPRLRRARRHQRPHPGHRRRHHPPRDDPHPRRDGAGEGSQAGCCCKSTTNCCSRCPRPRPTAPSTWCARSWSTRRSRR